MLIKPLGYDTAAWQVGQSLGTDLGFLALT